ncbi:MAG: DNA repair protein RecO [Rickettsiaceae bacterium]|nr:DNA repair protein RecO [Rickettsiaceae bacterium]
MKIDDKGIILQQSFMQENMLLLKILSENHGICSGIAKNINTQKKYDFNVGNLVKFERFARLENQLGVIKCYKIKSFQFAILESKLSLYMFRNLSNLISASFTDYEPCRAVFSGLEDFLQSIGKNSWLKYIKLEIEVLKHAGYGLVLNKCAVSNIENDLIYVSPKSGKAVSRDAAKGYEHLLLKLPNFISNSQEPKSSEEIVEGLNLTEYFFKRYIWPKKSNSAYQEQERVILKKIALIL